jgi:hypothetical protein
MGGDKNQRRHRGQGLQHARQRQAVGTGHVDIEQNHIKRWCCNCSMACTALAASPAPAPQVPCSRPTKCACACAPGLVIDHQSSQHAVGCNRFRHSGTSIRTWYTPFAGRCETGPAHRAAGQPIPHIAQSQPMAAFALPGGHGIGHLDHHGRPPALGRYANVGPLGAGLHAVAHRIFHQGLQQQRRQQGTVGRRVERPLHPQALTKTHLFNGQVALRQRNFFANVTGSPDP